MNPPLKEILEALRLTILDNPILVVLETHEMVFGKHLAKKIADLADQSVIAVWRDDEEAYEAAKERNLTF